MDWDKASPLLNDLLDKKHVKARSQGGGNVNFIEGWHAIAEMNRIFGFGAWNRETVDLRLLGDPRDVGGKIRVEYMARVRVTVTLDGSPAVIRDGCGFGQGIDKDVGQAHESALKEAETDAMKRAMMTFGNPFGLALYDKSQANVGTPEGDAKGGNDAPKAESKPADNRPAQTQSNRPDAAEIAVITLITQINGTTSLESLQSVWKANATKPEAADPRAIAAKDERKSALSKPQPERWPGDAAQRPLVDDSIPY